MMAEHEEQAGLESFDAAAGFYPSGDSRPFGEARRAEEAAADAGEGDPGLEAFDDAAGQEAPPAKAKPTKPIKRRRRKKSGSVYQREKRERETAAAAAAGPAAPPGKVKPKAPAAPALEPIDPQLVAKLIGAMTEPLCRRAGVPELDADELRKAGAAWAPVVDHFFPAIAARVGIWGAPIVWALEVIPPRVQLAVETRQEEERRRASGTFPEPADEPMPAMVATPAYGSGTPGPVVSDEAMARRRGAPHAELVT
jgi:hypothetical protein